MQRRKDNKGRVLKDGEVYRKSDGLYMYRWTAKNGKRHTIYDATLEGLREKEEKIQHDLADGIRIPECSLTLNDLFELWRKNKVGLKEHTFANYVYMYNRFVRDEIGMMKLKDIRVARQFFCETRTEFLRKNSQVLRSKSETRSLASTAPKMEGAVHVKGRVLAWGGAAFAAPPLAFCPWGSSYPSVASPASSAASWAATGSVYSDQP